MRTFLLRTLICISFALLGLSPRAHAGGPAFVAGSAFDPAVSGKPILWANGQVSYYTDQGDLSALLPQSSANAFVADAFSRWAAIATAAIAATQAGSLAEDVNGTNVMASNSGIVLPADIQPSATAKPVAIVYDLDGQVTEKVLGVGASDPSLCATNSVIGGVDHFSVDGHIAHALLIINGLCAQSNADLAPLKYHLVRAIGRVLGLGWSQANDNVQSGSPSPNNSDYAGFPLMHPLEPFCSGVITSCIPNADQLRMDDRAALSRLYPVTAQNVISFPGRQVFAAATVRIHGSVYFPDVQGNPGQPMQGVNVVARLIDPVSGLPSRIAVVTSVSGFLFHGNAGNRVSGFGSPQRFDAFGGDDATVEGFFDLSGLEIPPGQSTAQFQVAVEAVNPLYRDISAVGPYSSGTVDPSGKWTATLTAPVSAGADIAQDIVMTGAAATKRDDAQTIWHRPLAASGDWWGALTGYGKAEFYGTTVSADRTFTLLVAALNESLQPTTSKVQPELGLWTGANPTTAPPQQRADSFIGPAMGVTILSATTTPGSIQLGIVDYRGDGRPDYLYHAHFLYADAVSPARVESAGTTLWIQGIGFTQGITANVGGVAATVLAASENSLYLQAPQLSDGAKTISLLDPQTGAVSAMNNAVNYGVMSADQILTLPSANPLVSVGGSAPNPVRFRVVAGDGVTAVQGAAVTLSVSPNSSGLSVCGGAGCVVTSDATGEVDSFVAIKNAGLNTVTASIGNGQQATAAINGTLALTLTPAHPVTRLPSGSSLTLLLSAKLFSSGTAVGGAQVMYALVAGSGTLSSTSAITDANGEASVSLTLTNFISSVAVNACTPGASCISFNVQPVASSGILLQKIGGDEQIVPVGQPLQPLTLRVTDSSNPPLPIPGVPVMISGIVTAATRADCSPDTGICRPELTRPLAGFTAALNSDANGLVSFTPSLQASWGAASANIIATAGASASQSFNLRVFAPGP